MAIPPREHPYPGGANPYPEPEPKPSVNPDFDITHVGANEIQKGVFVRFRNKRTMYLDFNKWLPEDVAKMAIPVYTDYEAETQELVIPLYNGEYYRIHVLVLIIASNEEVHTRFAAEAPSYARKWGDAVRRARERRGWTQETLAQKAGTLQCAISRLEGGIYSPRVGTIDRMCTAFGISRYELLSGHEPAAEHSDTYEWFERLCEAVPELRPASNTTSELHADSTDTHPDPGPIGKHPDPGSTTENTNQYPGSTASPDSIDSSR